MIVMTLKRGRPATGRKESYYVINPNNFIRHMKKIKLNKYINALDYIHQQAFGIPLSWSQKEKIKSVKYGEII